MTDHVTRVETIVLAGATVYCAACVTHEWVGPAQTTKGDAHADAGDHILDAMEPVVQEVPC